jgi:hypothetical protein
MNRVFRVLAPLAVLAIFGADAFAQEAPPPPPDLIAQQSMEQQSPEGPGPGGPGPGGRGPGGPGFHRMELLGFGGFHGGKVVTGAPFSAVAVTTMSHSLADGTKISNTNKVTLYRDSQGRFRKEGGMPQVDEAPADLPRSFVVISDPVGSKNYLLNPDKKIAHVTQFRERGPKGGAPAADAAKGERGWGDNPNATKTSLGTQSINGISAEGTRYTRVIPAGQIGNDKPITITREVWYSPDLQMVVQSKHSDPRFGDTTYSLTNIQRTEPAANLFIVPSDYTLKQDAGPKGHGKRGPMPPPPPGEPATSPTM